METIPLHPLRRLQQLPQRLHPDTEPHIICRRIRKLAHCDTHHLIPVIDNRTARIPRIHRGINLDIIPPVHQLLRRRQRPLRQSKRHPVRIARHMHLPPDRQRIVLRQAQFRQRRKIMLHRHQRNVQLRIHQNDLRLIRIALIVMHRHRTVSLHHMVIRHDKIVRLQVQTTPGTSGMRHFKNQITNILFHENPL